MALVAKMNGSHTVHFDDAAKHFIAQMHNDPYLFRYDRIPDAKDLTYFGFVNRGVNREFENCRVHETERVIVFIVHITHVLIFEKAPSTVNRVILLQGRRFSLHSKSVAN